jgi:small nuclear ribonucleoprotein D2
MNESPLQLLSEIIINRKNVIVFTRNNKKIIGYLRAFDKHFNLIIENVREIWSSRKKGQDMKFHERLIQKLIIRGDSVILLLPN